MKNFNRILASVAVSIISSGICLGYGGDDVTSKTFFSVRPQFQTASPEKVSLFHGTYMNKLDNKYGGSLQVVVFGGESADRNELAKYFMPFGKTTLMVKETGKVDDDALIGGEYADLIASNFNIYSDNRFNNAGEENEFTSRISLSPKLKTFGVGFDYYQNLCKLFDGGENRLGKHDLWCEISAPIVYIDTSMNLRENIVQNGGGALAQPAAADNAVMANMIDAFKQTAWNYGKIDDSKDHDEWGIADIEVKVGLQKIRKAYNYSGYIGVVIPTGTKPKSHYVFEPIVGNNQHFGFLLGGSLGIDLYSDEDDKDKIQFTMHWHTQYLFSNTQRRSFDLKDKPWSRYLEVYEDYAQAANAYNHRNDADFSGNVISTPGINVFTKDVRVKPRFAFNLNEALSFFVASFLGEIGYNLYVRQSEDVRLKHAWVEGPVIKSFSGDGAINAARKININWNAAQSAYNANEVAYNKWKITESDLDLHSASHPSVISHTLYASLGYYVKKKKNPILLGIGGSYEFGSDDVALDRWTIWGKGSFSF